MVMSKMSFVQKSRATGNWQHANMPASLLRQGICSIYTSLIASSLFMQRPSFYSIIMARLPSAAAALLFSFLLTMVQLSTCDMVKASVSCVDCSHQDLSAVRVAVKCGEEKKLSYAVTDEDGEFEAKLPLSSSPNNCFAMLLGGSQQLCASKKALISKIVKANDAGLLTISTPLTFSSKCPSAASLRGSDSGIASSKTIDLPLPREWGLAPSSYYFPFMPIIGIP